MPLPFTQDQFFATFAQYNQAVWPFQWVLLILALAAVYVALLRNGNPVWFVPSLLAGMWLWMGIAYHWLFFAAINPAARLFGAMFVVQAGLFLWFGVMRRRMAVGWPGGERALVGSALLVYAVLLYPLLNIITDHQYPSMPTFGLPCPTTIFTLGMLCWVRNPFPRVTLIVPLLWTVIGGSAAFLLDVLPDLGLPASGLAVLVVVLTQRRPGSTDGRK